MEVTITLDETTYTLISNEAKVKQLKIEEMIAEAAREKYNPWEMDGDDPMKAEFEIVDRSLATNSQAAEGVDIERTDPMDLEMAAYDAMHPELVEHHLGEFVAIMDGKLVDYDADPNLLMKRLRAAYPKNKVIHVTKVRPTIQRTIVVRSPKFIPINE